MNAWAHFKVVNRHRFLVCKYCFRLGLYWQGLTHDLSKYSPQEFWVGAKYFQGDRSPNDAERRDKGYSSAWLHHKGRNRHHFEYWTDLNMKTGRYEPVPMPPRCLAEMVMDRIAACKTYQGAAYTNASPLEYFERARETRLFHPKTGRQLTFLLQMLAQRGERETFRFIRTVVLAGQPFCE